MTTTLFKSTASNSQSLSLSTDILAHIWAMNPLEMLDFWRGRKSVDANGIRNVFWYAYDPNKKLAVALWYDGMLALSGKIYALPASLTGNDTYNQSEKDIFIADIKMSAQIGTSRIIGIHQPYQTIPRIQGELLMTTCQNVWKGIEV